MTGASVWVSNYTTITQFTIRVSPHMKSWLDLEARFRGLAPNLQHCRLDAQWGAAGEYWRIAGTGPTPSTHEYELLSAVAGQFLGQVLIPRKEGEKTLLQVTDPKIRWYSALKLLSPSFGNKSYGQQLNEDGRSAGFIYIGSVSSIAEASANLCLSLQASHPIVERKSKWQWLHENYIKGLIIGIIIVIVGAVAKLFTG